MLPREQHREEGYDLKGKNDNSLLGWNDIYMEHINRILDLMIVVDPEKRRSVDNIKILIKQASRLVRKEYTPIIDGLRQPCTYCGEGFYNDIPITSLYSGFHITDIENWRILICNACGHVQSFRVDKAYNKERWK